MPRDITLDTHLPHRPDTVWRALTDPNALSQWLMPVDGFTPVVGSRFRLTAKPMPGWDGIVHCEILAIDEPRHLSYTWHGTQMTTPTTVTWTLTPTDDNGTHLRLHHTGFTGLGGAILRLMHRGGWRKFLLRQLPTHLTTTDHTID
nr:SRPBCC domain-containing protein [Kibdelosporangium sp. MJ126-NF4]CEL13783.1 hypothetical protein [Kibdelosporangium sp. MJ126-NF4]CTQ88151.1 hypothetical protein [Kibdelosporangium sp. MJ126-NF4]